MSTSRIAPPLVVIYATRLLRLATFYQQVFSLERVDEAPDFVLLAGDGLELAIVQAPEGMKVGEWVDVPVMAREHTPIKLSLAVADIEALREVINRSGGALKPASATWSWRGQAHLDGHDPEGNVFQLREMQRAQ